MKSICLIYKCDFQYIPLVNRNPWTRFCTIKGHCLVQNSSWLELIIGRYIDYRIREQTIQLRFTSLFEISVREFWVTDCAVDSRIELGFMKSIIRHKQMHATVMKLMIFIIKTDEYILYTVRRKSF